MTDNTQKINAKSVARYILLPGIIPRAKELGSEGFGYLAFLFANVFQAVRILPAAHPFVQPSNIGAFSIRQVLAAAANNIEVSRKNIDQMVVFGAIMLAIILLALQFFLLLFGILSGSAFAGTNGNTVTWTSMFETQYPQVDIAFLMLDYVFGLPALSAGSGASATSSFFGSNALMATNGPTAFHQGMHALFNFYNLALMLVGTLIFVYYIIVVVIETAQTGVPFGRRFSKLYAPMRLVMAVGLLVPFGYGFNSAQYIVLGAAKIGSSFATNGWILFNSNLNNPVGADNKALLARPRFPPPDELLYFSSVYHACREAYAINMSKGVCISAYVIYNGNAISFVPNSTSVCSGSGGGGAGRSDYWYKKAKEDFKTGDMEIVLGELNPTKHVDYAGGVRPYCGKMTVSLNHENPSIWEYNDTGRAAEGQGTWGDQDGSAAIRATEAIHYDMVKELLRVPGEDAPTGTDDRGETLGTRNLMSDNNPFSLFGERAAHAKVPGRLQDPCYKSGELNDAGSCGKPHWKPPSKVFQDALDEARGNRDLKLNNSYIEFYEGLNLKVKEDLQRRGWGGAGIWYNHIADINGGFTGAIYSSPSVRKWPEVMEKVRDARQAQDKNVSSCNIFEPNLADKTKLQLTGQQRTIAQTLSETYKYFNCEKPNQDNGDAPQDVPASVGTSLGNVSGGCGSLPSSSVSAATRGVSSNVFIDFVSVLFGLNGLFDLRACSKIDPGTGQSIVHPLAQLATVGKSLIENAVRSMGMAMGAAFGGGMLGAFSQSLGAAFESASGMFVGVASIGLTIGFVLYYILPFLPFIYFFFAVGSWVKSIFEAMVGAPLWALAHLRIDGEGLPGASAVSGYFLVFEIFLRPIVTVFGLIGGMAVFGAMVAVLNEIFDLVTSNVTGVGPEGSQSTVIENLRRGILDQFFFTVMYAVLVYMMAQSSFKMIDSIPKFVMRWMNTRVSTFNDNKDDPAAHLGRYAAIGANQFAAPLVGAGRDLASAAGRATGALITEASNSSQGAKQ